MSEPETTPTTALVAIDFHGDQIVTFQHGGQPYVAMRRVVENLGLGWGSQRQKLAESGQRFACDDIVTHDTTGRLQPMLAMPVAKLPLWLASINPNKITDPMKRERIELYQAESAIALHDYWTKGVAVRGDMDGIVTGLDGGAMRSIGGMMKGIIAKALHELVPALVEQRLATERLHIVEGVSSLEVLEIAGFQRGQRPRGMAQFLTRKLATLHMELGVRVARSRHGSGKVWLFDEATCRRWLDRGGKRDLNDWRNHKLGVGQITLKLVS